MDFKDLPALVPRHYRVDHDWAALPAVMYRYCNEVMAKLDMDPPFQRGHVWTEQQQINYIQWKLQGGAGGDEIYLNCPGWMNDFRGPFQLVDGKQRIEAIIKFLKDDLVIFTKYKFSDFEGRLPSHCFLHFNVNDLKTERLVLLWYYKINFGGTPHSEKERAKILQMIEESKVKKTRRGTL